MKIRERTFPLEDIVFRNDYINDDIQWETDKLSAKIRNAIDDFKVEYPLCYRITARVKVHSELSMYGVGYYLGICVRGEQENDVCPHGIEKTPLTECVSCGDKNWSKS